MNRGAGQWHGLQHAQTPQLNDAMRKVTCCTLDIVRSGSAAVPMSLTWVLGCFSMATARWDLHDLLLALLNGT